MKQLSISLSLEKVSLPQNYSEQETVAALGTDFYRACLALDATVLKWRAAGAVNQIDQTTLEQAINAYGRGLGYGKISDFVMESLHETTSS